MKKSLLTLLIFFVLNSLAFSQSENQQLIESEIAAPDGSFQITITMANGSRDIIELSEDILKEISILRKADEDFDFNLTPTIFVRVFSYSKIKDKEFQAPEIYVFID
jgi:hypothetical protein